MNISIFIVTLCFEIILYFGVFSLVFGFFLYILDFFFTFCFLCIVLFFFTFWSFLNILVFKNYKTEFARARGCIAFSDESEPSWLELKYFQLGLARDLFHSARNRKSSEKEPKFSFCFYDYLFS